MGSAGPGTLDLYQPAGGWDWLLTWLAAESGSPKAGISLLVSGTGSWGSWLRCPKCLRTSVSLLVGGAGAQGVPELVPGQL